MTKKILILTDQISQIGGINSLIFLKSNYWVDFKNYNVDIITTEQKKKKPFYPIHKKVGIHDLNINYNRYKSYFSPSNFFKILKNYIKLQLKIKKMNPDIVIIANHIPVSFFFIFIKSKAKFIKEFHFSKYNLVKRKDTFLTKFERYIERKFDFLVVLNEEERKFYNHSNVITIPNPISFDNSVEPIYFNRKHIAMAAGRISEVKRFDILINIWSKLIEKTKDWKLEIYGNGEVDYVNSLKEKIKSLNLSNYIEIKASTNNLKKEMDNKGLYLMTSSAECFPMVLLEAQSCGLPIISFDCPTGPRNIIKHNKNGILVENNNEDQFLKELLEMITNESKRIKLAKMGFTNVKKYNTDIIMNIWDKQIINS